jgi:UDP-N-acetyl-D-glucosamine dehydrogenase
MPSYVADRALALVNDSVAVPRVLILGVAYKPGVGDVRETPAKGLLIALESRGAEVAWIDPLVENWEGSEPAPENWDCDVAIIAINQMGLNIEPILNRAIPILDCTNSYSSFNGVNLL